MAINLSDYSETAASKGWGAGWPTCAGAKAAGTAVVQSAKSGVRVSVHKRVARLVQLLLDATEARGYMLKPGQCGGYNCRAISGTSRASACRTVILIGCCCPNVVIISVCGRPVREYRPATAVTAGDAPAPMC